MAPPKSASTKAKAPAAAPSAAKKENKPPAAAAKSTAKAPAAAAKKAAPAEPKKAPAPAAPPKVAEKKTADAKPAVAKEAKKVKTEKPKPKKAAPSAPKKTTALKGKSTGGGKKKKITNRFVIDCTLPAEDQLFNCADFEKFLRERIKVSGKTSNFGGNLNIERGEKNKLAVNASIPFSKRYLKYLTKKYLKKNLLRDTLRVIATSKDGYELRYFQIGNEADEDEEDAE